MHRSHTDSTELLKPCHRFKALNASGLYGLAKDLVRLVVEHIDTAALQKIVPPAKNEKWGSLKSLEKVVATVASDKNAHTLFGPLQGICNLRLADAHVPTNELEEAYTLARIDKNASFVLQGRDLLIACVNCLHMIADALQ